MLPGGNCLEEAPQGYVGYIYIIDFPNRKGEMCYYIGKKLFEFSKKKKITKKVIKATKTRRRVERVKVDSDWKDYWGSSKLLQAYIEERGGTDGFKRRIIELCKDKTTLTFREVECLVDNRVLYDEYSWNGQILNKFFKQVKIRL
jgi:kynurenine formamidase